MSLFPYSGSFRLTTEKGGIIVICASIQTNQSIYIKLMFFNNQNLICLAQMITFLKITLYM
jgi:hypothetical protein